MKRWVGCFLQMLSFLAGGIPGLILGMNTGPELVAGGLFSGWKSFHLPSGHQAARFHEGEQVIIETEGGMFFAQGLSLEDEPNWVQIEEPQARLPAADVVRGGECWRNKPYRDGLFVRPPLRVVVDRLTCFYSPHAESFNDLIFIIDGRGGVWRWLRRDFGYGVLFWFPFCAALGALAGGFIGLGLYSWVSRRFRRALDSGDKEVADRWRI